MATAPTITRYAALPAELRQAPRWVTFVISDDLKRPGRKTKILMQARRPNRKASSTNSATWATFTAAVEAESRHAHLAGIGFVLGDGFAGIDCDHCIDVATGEMAAWARDVLEAVPSYSEYSPSGSGIHILMRGTLPPGRRKVGDLEMYCGGRFFTVTGRHVQGTPQSLEERTEAVRVAHERFMMPAPVSMPRRDQLVPRLMNAVCDDDGAALERARRASNGHRFSALYAGDASAYGSASEADLALISHLAFWCDGEASRVDRLFRASGLFREKWDEKRGELTYGQRTVAKALSGSTSSARRLIATLDRDRDLAARRLPARADLPPWERTA